MIIFVQITTISFVDTESTNQRTFFMERECYDYDADIDELFSLAVNIIHSSGEEKVVVVAKLCSCGY